MKYPAALWLITAALVATCTVYAQDVPNRAPNAGFEAPAGVEDVMPAVWSFFSSRINGIAVTSETARNGKQCVRMRAQNVPTAFQGLITELPVTGGEKYTFSVYVINSKVTPLKGSAELGLVVEWRDSQNREVARVASATLDTTISKIRWTQLALSGITAPENATRAVFGIHLHDGARGAEGTVLLDDVVIAP